MRKVVVEKRTIERSFGKSKKLLSVNHASLCCARNSTGPKLSWQSENKLFYGAA